MPCPEHVRDILAPKRRAAFTLVELAVVMVVLCMLFAVAMPALSLARRHARSAVCMDNLGQVGRAIERYRSDHGDRIPGSLGRRPSLAPSGPRLRAPGLSDRARTSSLASYYADPSVLDCPEITKAGTPSYGINGLVVDALETFHQIPSPSSTPLVFDSRHPVGYHCSDLDKRHLGHVNILYADFRVARRYFNARLAFPRSPSGSARSGASGLTVPFAQGRVGGAMQYPMGYRVPEHDGFAAR